MMEIQGHKPILKGSSYFCADCGRFLLDIRTAARLKSLTDVDPVKLSAVINRFPHDLDLAERLAKEDPRQIVAAYKLADKFNDFLMNPKARPDLQTPEAQDFLNKLRNKYLNSKTDELMPWIIREWKKGRIRPHPEGYPTLQIQAGPDYEYEEPDGTISSWHNLSEGNLDHWADWYGSDHPSRQGQDIMKLTAPELHQRIKDWDADMREQAGGAAQVRGDVVHSYPDGWTVQQLTTPQQLADEGEKMGHCVGSYANAVQNGKSLIYSLRDHHNEPHATWEISPNWFKSKDPDEQAYHGDQIMQNDALMERYNRGELTPTPEDGTMEQIQGKGNKPPITAYQRRIKDYFEKTMPEPGERPKWDDQHYDDLDEFMDQEGHLGYVPYHPGDYGLETPKTTFDWPALVERQLGWGEYEPDAFVQKAVEHGQFHQLAHAAEEAIDQRRQERRENLEHEYEKYGEPEFAANYYQEDPEPNPDEPPFNEGDYDANGYNKAWEEWESREMAARDAHMSEWMNARDQEEFEEQEYQEALEAEIAAQKLRERQEGNPPVTSRLNTIRTPHENFITGEPCYCTFLKSPEPQWREAALVCEACGDPLVHGKCKRCDWGGWSDAMTDGEPIADVTKEVRPAIQA